MLGACSREGEEPEEFCEPTEYEEVDTTDIQGASREEVFEAMRKGGEVTVGKGFADEESIEVGDTLQVLRGASIFATGLVQADGNILLTHLGWVRAAGMTRADLEAKITDAYNEFFTDNKTFYVIVGKPQQ